MRHAEAIMASAADRGLALWHAVLDAATRWPESDDVMGVGVAGDEVVVVRIHCLEKDLFEHKKKGRGHELGHERA